MSATEAVIQRKDVRKSSLALPVGLNRELKHDPDTN